MILRLLFTVVGICTVALVFFLLGRETERRAIHRRLRSAGSMNSVAHTALDAVVREVQEDSAEVMREMEFYGEASEVVNCRTTGNG